MKTLDQYLTLLFLKNFIFGLLGLAAIYTFQEMLVQILDQDFPVRQTLIYNGMQFPFVMIQMLPPSVLLATVLTLSGLARTQELVAIYSLGIGLGRVVSLLLSLVFMISCLALVSQDRLLPPIYKRKTLYYWHVMKKKPDFHLDFKRDKVWYRSGDVIYNLRAFKPETNTILGMGVYQFDRSFHLREVIDAESAQFQNNQWILQNGTVTTFPQGDFFPYAQKFKERELKIAETPFDFQQIEKEVDGLRLRDLWSYILKMRAAGVNTNKYEVKFHSKISTSFITLVMCTLGVPFSVRNRREGGLAKDLGLCLVVTFFYWIFYSVGLSLGSNDVLSPMIAAWAPSALFAVLAGGLILRTQRK